MKTLQELRSCGSKKEETMPVKGKGKKKVDVTTDSKIKTDNSNNTETTMSEVKSADKKPEIYVDQDGRTKIRMVPVVREQEEIDELNKSTLQSYKAQATGQAMSRSFAAQDAKDSNKADTHAKKAQKRMVGVAKAADRLTKEGTGNLKPGWMLKKDPELAKKLKDKIDLAKKRQASYGDKSKGVSK